MVYKQVCSSCHSLNRINFRNLVSVALTSRLPSRDHVRARVLRRTARVIDCLTNCWAAVHMRSDCAPAPPPHPFPSSRRWACATARRRWRRWRRRWLWWTGPTTRVRGSGAWVWGAGVQWWRLHAAVCV